MGYLYENRETGNNYEKSVFRMICGSPRKTAEVKTPKYLCKSCTKCSDNRCTFYNRPIITDYNRCFNHSQYSPLTTSFKEPKNLTELIEKEEKKVA